MRIKGVIAAAATPLKPDHSIDLEHLTRHCGWLLDKGGCHGVNLLGTTGEATSFSVEQRLAAMRAVAKSGLPLARIMVGTGAAAFEDAVQLTAEAKGLGFAGALLLPPFYYKGIDQDGLFAFVAAVIARVGATGLPLYLYHFPANSGVPYHPDVVARLREAWPETVLGLKDSSNDLDYSGGLVARLPGFDVFPAAEGALARASELGFAGCISSSANLSGPWARAYLGTDPRSRADLANAVGIRQIMTGFPTIAGVKAALHMLTGEDNWTRLVPPLLPLDESRREILRTTLQQTPLLAA